MEANAGCSSWYFSTAVLASVASFTQDPPYAAQHPELTPKFPRVLPFLVLCASVGCNSAGQLPSDTVELHLPWQQTRSSLNVKRDDQENSAALTFPHLHLLVRSYHDQRMTVTVPACIGWPLQTLRTYKTFPLSIACTSKPIYTSSAAQVFQKLEGPRATLTALQHSLYLRTCKINSCQPAALVLQR